MKSSHYYRLLVFVLSLSCTPLWAAGFGDIPASLALPAGTSVRRNAGNTLFESYTPSTGTVTSIATTSPITGGTITTTGTIAINDAAADGTTKGAAAFTAADFNAASGLISIDYANGQAASGSSKGFLTAADWTTFNAKGSGSVTSVGLVGTSNQITVTGSTPITTSGSWTLSVPTSARLDVAKLTNLTTNGFVVTSGSDGTLGIDTNTYLTNNQLITLSGEVSGSGATSITTTQTHFVTFTTDGVGQLLLMGIQNPYKTKYGGTLVGWTAMCKPSGSVTMDIVRAANGAGLPTASIVGGGGTKPAIASGVENSSTSFSGWTSTTITAGDNLAVDLSGVTTATFCEITLYFK